MLFHQQAEMIPYRDIFSDSFTVCGSAPVFTQGPVFSPVEGLANSSLWIGQNLAWHFLNLLEKSLLHTDWFQFSGEHVF